MRGVQTHTHTRTYMYERRVRSIIGGARARGFLSLLFCARARYTRREIPPTDLPCRRSAQAFALARVAKVGCDAPGRFCFIDEGVVCMCAGVCV